MLISAVVVQEAMLCLMEADGAEEAQFTEYTILVSEFSEGDWVMTVLRAPLYTVYGVAGYDCCRWYCRSAGC